MEDNFVMIDIKWNSKNKMGIINDYALVEEMREKYKIVCEPIGTPAISKKQNKLLIGPYMINKYDLFYLYENKYIIINSKNVEDEKNFLIEYENNKNSIYYIVYKDLHQKDYFVLPGKKYGVDFLGYKDDPNFVHSNYLISCKKINENIDVKDVINNERVSLATLKGLIYAFVDNEKEDDTKINYINISWTQIKNES
jgi:tRNA-intron lyase